jgi:hypothetical protein
MKNFPCQLLFAFLVLSYFPVSAQKLSNRVYDDVIEYNHQNTVKVGIHWLTSVVVSSANKTMVLYNNAGIPDSLFFYPATFSNELKEFILISPKGAKIISMPDGGHGRTVPITTLYHVRRENNRLLIDSKQYLNRDLPKIHFRNAEGLAADVRLTYHQDCYGSACPIALNPGMPPYTITAFFSGYEKVGDIFISKEINTQHTPLYFTLSGLSATEKVSFIIDRYYSNISNRHLIKLMPYPAKIFSPEIINIKNLRIWSAKIDSDGN